MPYLSWKEEQSMAVVDDECDFEVTGDPSGNHLFHYKSLETHSLSELYLVSCWIMKGSHSHCLGLSQRSLCILCVFFISVFSFSFSWGCDRFSLEKPSHFILWQLIGQALKSTLHKIPYRLIIQWTFYQLHTNWVVLMLWYHKHATFPKTGHINTMQSLIRLA